MTSDEPEPYIGDVRDENNADAATQVQGLGSAHTLFRALDNGIQGAMIQADADARTAEWGQAQAVRLEQGLETQSAPPFGGSNYAHYSTTDLHAMVTTNIDPGAVGELGAAWHGLGETYTAVARSLGAAVSSSESGWTGAAGDAAREFLTAMANWADVAGQGAQLAGNRTGMQSEAAQAARNSMPTPVEPPTATDVRQVLLGNALNPATGAAQLDQRFQAAQQAHDQAVQVVQTYDTNLAAVGDTMPAFAVPPAFNPGNSTGETGHGTTESGTETPGRQAMPASGTSPGSADGGPGASGGDAPGAPTTVGPGDPAGESMVSPQSAGFSEPGAGVGPGGSGAGDVVGLDGSGAGGVAGPGGSGVRGAVGFSGSGVRGPASLGEPDLRDGGARGTTGAGAGVGPEEAVGNGEGLAGVPMGRGGRSGEDKERYPPSYLTNPDPDGTFGIARNVAPPVIGA